MFGEELALTGVFLPLLVLLLVYCKSCLEDLFLVLGDYLGSSDAWVFELYLELFDILTLFVTHWFQII